jgi:hypothetical protein
MTPIQGHAALTVACLAVFITLTLLMLALRSEKKRPRDESDDH